MGNMGKPGWKTTEFWVSLGCMALGALTGSGLITNQPILQGLGIVEAFFCAGTYSWARATTKRAEASARAVGTLKVK